mgnify:CR=1 FL=1
MWMKKRYVLRSVAGDHVAIVARRGDRLAVQIDEGRLQDVDAAVVHDGRALSLRLGDRVHLIHLSAGHEAGAVTATLLGRPFELTVLDELRALVLDTAGDSRGGGTVASDIPGLVVDVKVAEGQRVRRGEAVVVVEAMKMQNELTAAIDGVVRSVRARIGATVNAGDPLVMIEPDTSA